MHCTVCIVFCAPWTAQLYCTELYAAPGRALHTYLFILKCKSMCPINCTNAQTAQYSSLHIKAALFVPLGPRYDTLYCIPPSITLYIVPSNIYWHAAYITSVCSVQRTVSTVQCGFTSTHTLTMRVFKNKSVMIPCCTIPSCELLKQFNRYEQLLNSTHN